MKKKIAFIGGDKRNLYLLEMMREKYEVQVYGLKQLDFGVNWDLFVKSIEDCNYIVFPIPTSNDGINLYTPLCTSSNISIAKCAEIMRDKKIFSGKMKPEHYELFQKNGNEIVDITASAEFKMNNAIPTAEGIIAHIIYNTEITIDNCNALILGYGNVGKKTAQLLGSMNANIFCYDIAPQVLANIESSGYNIQEQLDENIKKMDVIVNTVPEMILNSERFKYINCEGTLIIDVASNPGGVDFEYARSNGYKVVHLLGIPGKIAPRASAKYMMNMIEKYME